MPHLPANLGTLSCTLYATGYLLLEPVAGALLAPLLLGSTAGANFLTSTYGARATYAAVAVHVLSWGAQFIGHGVYEGRAPALRDNLAQALFLAPFFVWMELLFACGYRPDLKARVDREVQTRIAKFRAEKAARKAGT